MPGIKRAFEIARGPHRCCSGVCCQASGLPGNGRRACTASWDDTARCGSQTVEHLRHDLARQPVVLRDRGLRTGKPCRSRCRRTRAPGSAWLRSRLTTCLGLGPHWARKSSSAGRGSRQKQSPARPGCPAHRTSSKKRSSLVDVAAPAAQHVAAQFLDHRRRPVPPARIAAVEGIQRHPVRALDHDRLAVDIKTKCDCGSGAISMRAGSAAGRFRRPGLAG